ncbi:MAG: YdcF family protein [Acidimicrobiales bacterium]|nr:YdcF family protein [Acidimicrobiales bacterium]
MTAVAEVAGEPAAPPPPRAVPRWRRPRFLLRLLAVLAGVVVLYVAITFVQVWQGTTMDHARPAAAIVVLGAAQYNGRPSPALRDRLDHALALWQQGVAPTVVVTGGRQPGDRFTEATAGYDYLRRRGVPDKVIRKEVQGHSTYESLAATARFLKHEGIRDVVLVTSASHAERVAAIAREVGLVAHVSPAGHQASLRSLVRETFAVSLGRVLGFRRLDHLTR